MVMCVSGTAAAIVGFGFGVSFRFSLQALCCMPLSFSKISGCENGGAMTALLNICCSNAV